MQPGSFVYSPPTEPRLEVLHADDDVLVVAKPAGLLSVPGRDPALADSVASRAEHAYPGARIVHRLDMDTSGVMVLGRHRSAHRELSRQFEKRLVEKVYIARVAGRIPGEAGGIDAPLRCDWPNRPRQMIDAVAGREAFTAWEVIGCEAGATRLRLMPHTGRSHQLRVHLSSIGHPIIGDPIYAPADIRGAACRLQLHAVKLVLSHPRSGTEIAFRSACPF